MRSSDWRSDVCSSDLGKSPGASRHARHLATAAVLFFMIGIGGWWFLRPTPAHSMMVRLAGFRPLSAGLPPTLREAVAAEITAAFNADGVQLGRASCRGRVCQYV